MADIQAFRGLRYDLSKTGALSDVVAPPYDVISPEMQADLSKRNSHNIVRLILPSEQDLLGEQTVYESAASLLKEWVTDGVLRQDPVSTIYVYHQCFEFEGQSYERRGFLCRVKLEDFGEGTIYPHEETHSTAKEDRYQLMRQCHSNLSPIFGIYPDPENEAQAILEAAIEDRTPLVAVDENKVQHKLWQVKQVDAIAKAASILGTTSVYIADGHHCYETSCRIRDESRSDGSAGSSDYTMMMLISMNDPGLAVLPTHRLFRGMSPISSDQLRKQIESCFDVETIGTGADLASDVWEEIQMADDQTSFGLYCRQDDTWLLAKLNVEGLERMEKVAPEQSDHWRSLGVSLLHKLLIEDLLGQAALPAPKYVHGIEEVVAGIVEGDASGRDATGQSGTGDPFELAALVMPANVEDVKVISEKGLRMPAKSTYFYPKLLSGLVINPLDS